MKKLSLIIALIGLFTLLQGCATGPSYSQMQGTIAPIPEGKGRIYFYRPSTFGAAVRPEVRLDGTAVGKAKSKGFFYVDAAPGNHVIETTTEVSRRLSFTLDAGQTRYVKLSVSFGFAVGHVYPELVDEEAGRKGVAECKYDAGK